MRKYVLYSAKLEREDKFLAIGAQGWSPASGRRWRPAQRPTAAKSRHAVTAKPARQGWQPPCRQKASAFHLLTNKLEQFLIVGAGLGRLRAHFFLRIAHQIAQLLAVNRRKLFNKCIQAAVITDQPGA